MNTCFLELSLSENPSPNTCRENKSESVTVIVSVSANGTIGVQSKSWFSRLSCCWLSFRLVSAIMSDFRFGVCGAEAVLAPAEVTLSSC